MSILTRLRAQARYNVLTPIFMLSLGAASPALAATVVIDAPTTNVEILTDNSLINRSEITGNANAAVYANSDIGFITNEADASITGGTYTAIYITGSADSITNSGLIESTGDYGIYIDGAVTNFTNSGTLKSYDLALFVAGDLEHFVNTHEITSTSYTAITVGGAVKTFVNSGTISGYSAGVEIVGHVEDFTNTGTITTDLNKGVSFGASVGTLNTGDGTADSYIRSQSTAIYVNVDAGSIHNTSIIESLESSAIVVETGHLTSFQNDGVVSASFDNPNTAGHHGLSLYSAGNITNSGIILSASGDGIFVVNDVESIINTGKFSSSFTGIGATHNGITVGDKLTRLENNAVINAGNIGVDVGGYLDYLKNTASIYGGEGGVKVGGSIISLENSGTIIADDGYAIYVSGGVTDLNNSGTISGYEGIYIGLGNARVTNSGTIESFGSLKALEFNDDYNTLAIGTGARFVGEVDFGGGANSYLDARDFHGSIAIDVTSDSLDMGNVQAGDNYYYQTPEVVLIVGGGFVNQSSQPVTNLASGLGELLTSKLALGDVVGNPDDLVMNYAAKPQSAAEMATRDAMAPSPSGASYWADAIGGVGRNGEAETADAYGALVAGAHTQLTPDLTLGMMGGFAHTTLDIGDGSQTIKATIGIVGAYGSYDMGNVRTDFSLIGGLSGNDSSRTTTVGNDALTDSASFGGWFIAPTVGAYLPVLTTETGEISLGGRLGYLGGGFSGYTEEGSDAALTVDAQSYSVVTALLEVRGENAVSDTVTLNGSLGIFAQNQSGSAVTVSLPGVDLIGPGAFGGTSYGLKAGIGAEVAISDAFNVNLGVTGTVRNNGATASANLGIGGKF